MRGTWPLIVIVHIWIFTHPTCSVIAMLGFILFLAITARASAQDYDLIHCAYFGTDAPTDASIGCAPLGIPLRPNTTDFVLRVLHNETCRHPLHGVVLFASEQSVVAPKAALSRAWVLSNYLVPFDYEISQSGMTGTLWTLDAIRAKFGSVLTY